MNVYLAQHWEQYRAGRKAIVPSFPNESDALRHLWGFAAFDESVPIAIGTNTLIKSPAKMLTIVKRL